MTAKWKILTVVGALLLPAPTTAGVAKLDLSFGSAGIAAVPVGTHVAHCYAVARQPDGALVLAGGSDHGTTEYDATLVRLLPNGQLDPSFGDGGVVVRRHGLASFEGVFKAVAIAPNGFIVAAGHDSATGPSRAVVARFDQHGNLDPTFGNGGRVYPLGLGSASDAAALVPEADGGLIVAATTWFPGFQPGGFPWSDFHTDMSLIRLRSDGTPDPAFGNGGIRVVDRGALEYAIDVLRQSDGSLVLVGALLNGTTLDYDVLVLRYDSAGALDESYGDGGRVMLDLGYSDYSADAVALAEDGLLIMSGGPGVTLARLDRDGQSDPTFGDAGIVHTGPETWVPRAVAVDARGRPLVAVLDITNERVGRLVRFRYDGGTRGSVRRLPELPFDPGHLVLQPDGKLQVITFNGAVWQATRLRSRVAPPVR